jgi:S1-C subfamily serine protease
MGILNGRVGLARPSGGWRRVSAAPILSPSIVMEANDVNDVLSDLSTALAARTAASRHLVLGISAGTRRLSGTLWRPDVAVASAQVFPDTDAAEVATADGTTVRAQVAGRDPATNIVALRLAQPLPGALPAAAEPMLGGLALALAAGAAGVSVRLAIVRALGPEWHSLKGGRIDRRIVLDLALGRSEEGGPVLDAAGGLVGMSTAGPRGRALVIPAATVERVLPVLLTAGRIERGWLGLGLHPVAVPDAFQAEARQARGLMVVELSRDGPAAQAGLLPGDIIVEIAGAAVSRPSTLARALGPESIGQKIALRLIRAGAVLGLEATVAARP